MIPEISVDVRPARDFLKQLTQRELPRVIGRSLDRTAASGKTFLSRRLRERLALKKAVIDQSIKTRRSGEIGRLESLSGGSGWFELRVSGNPIPLRDFNARLARGKVTYQVSRARGRRAYASLGQPAFIVARFGGHVFVRKGPEPKGPEKAGIRKVHGPSLPQHLQSTRLQREVIAHCTEFWNREVIRNAKFALQRRSSK